MSFFDTPAEDHAEPTESWLGGRWERRLQARLHSPRWRRRAGALTGAAAVATGALIALLPSTTASADPSASTWAKLRSCESSNNYAINTGNGYYGAYQFDLATWKSVGGTGYPNQASKTEQDKRALILYRERGWQPWTCAYILGLKEDKDARSGRTSDINVPAAGTPAWPGTYYIQGMSDAKIQQWQKQMAKRGAPLHGTSYFGPSTQAVVDRVQALNGIPRSGRIGPETWQAAWSGKYTKPAAVKAAAKPAPKPAAKPAPKPKAPAWPGTYYVKGMSSYKIVAWQKQMAKRGAKFDGSGYFGTYTQAVVDRIQKLNGIPNSGRIGPETWAAAWTGKY